MIPISEADIRNRIARDNPWWEGQDFRIPEDAYPRRAYFGQLKALVFDFSVRRATVLLGPRRVGKTVMIKQMVAEAISSDFDPRSIMYVSIDTPVYSGKSLEYFINLMPNLEPPYKKIVIFDEIQYLPKWENHLKDLVDTYPNIKFVATGSAAAALKLKSQESGAGRFSDFMLPPLTFYEFLLFIRKDEDLIRTIPNNEGRNVPSYEAVDINLLNEKFIDYLNYGGYPEAVLNESVRNNPEQFIRNDIIDKVLLKDLPSLYGINAIQELNKLFAFLAYNAGNEASFEKISQESGITKPTIKKYIEYLESAFLILKVGTVDDNCRSMKRERNFKIYLNNPSMRAALFAPVVATENDKIGHLTESAIFSQWQHSPKFRNTRYARWRNEGEVDIVYLETAQQTPAWIGEIKWSDRARDNLSEVTRSIQTLLRKHKSITNCFITTKTQSGNSVLEGRPLKIWPSAVYCYTVGRNIATRVGERGDAPSE